MLIVNAPRRLATRPSHPDYRADFAQVGVIFNGVRRTDVDSYDADAGVLFVRQRAGRVWAMDNETGWYATIQLQGTVEPYWRSGVNALRDPALARPPEAVQAAIDANASKQARKAAKRLRDAQRAAAGKAGQQ